MSDWKKKLGVHNNARSPATVSNAQHHDKSMAERDISGSPGTPEEIIVASTTPQAVPNHSVLRVVNTNAAIQFLFIGKQADVPGGAPTITTGYAIPSNFYENIYLGELEGNESIFVKSSSDDVQVIVMDS